MIKRYYSLETEGEKADLYIYGDITSWPWLASDVSSYLLSKKLEELKDVSEISVYINSYGGEVAEGLAIYNALKRHKAKVVTHCDGFACSISSVIFMAGDERVMSNTSTLMIHNAWSRVSGNANDFRKEADDLEKITQLSVNAYMSQVSVSEEELKTMMDEETWLMPQEALEYGFATSISGTEESEKPSQNVRKDILQQIRKPKKEEGSQGCSMHSFFNAFK